MFPRVFVHNFPHWRPDARRTQLDVVVPFPAPVPGHSKFPLFDPTASLLGSSGTYMVNESSRFLAPATAPRASTPVDPEDPVGGSPCFAGGTLILTSKGPRAVETLRPCDLVQTRDNGLQPLLWSGHRALEQAELDLAPNQRPILIAQGALGRASPHAILSSRRSTAFS